MNFEMSAKEKLEKILSDNFEVGDLSDYLIKKVKPNAKITSLKMKGWTKIGNVWIFLNKITGNMDDTWIEVLVVKDFGNLNSLVQHFVQLAGNKLLVMEWNIIPGTNLVFDAFYAGDGENVAALVAELAE